MWTGCGLGDFVYLSSSQYSSMLLAVMSIEKYFALYFPLKAKSYCTVGTAKWVTAILAVVIAGFNIPSLIWNKSIDGKYCAMTKHTDYIPQIHSILYSYVPIIIMVLANAAIIYKLMCIKYKRISHTNESVSKSSTRGSVMVVTVSLAFIILTTPCAVDSAIKFKLSDNPFGSISMLIMQYLNSSINGMLYCIFGQKFRNELKKVMMSCKKERIQSNCTSLTPVTTDRIMINSTQHSHTTGRTSVTTDTITADIL